MASGANRGAYYAGFPAAFREAGIAFDLFAGVSAGGIAAAWFAAGDEEALLASWREASRWRIALHPWLAHGRRQTVDTLIQQITLRMMNVEAARTADTEVLVSASRIVRPALFGRFERRIFSSREAADAATFGLMLRATALVPVVNGLRSAVQIGDERYVDGGLTGRIPLEMVPAGRFDEIWAAACSPNGIRELAAEVKRWNRPERLIVVTPSKPLPVGRWTMEWHRIEGAIRLGKEDMLRAIEQVRRANVPVVRLGEG